MILLAEHDEPSLAAKKKQRPVASEKATSTPKNRVWNFFGSPLGRTCSKPDLSAETATGSVQFSYETASGQAYYYTSDHLGSVRELVNGSGTIVSRLGYDPYGRTTTLSGTILPTMQYAGMYLHATSGLNLTLNRGYDSNTGRWLSQDPLNQAEIREGPNLYSYVQNLPVSMTDVLGLASLQPKSNFAVLGSQIQTGYGGLLQSLGIDHVDISYNGTVVYVGSGGGVARKGTRVSDYKTRSVSPLFKSQSGMLKYGPNKCCKDATDGDIIQCLQKRQRNTSRNCQGDVADAISDCCLGGWSSFVSITAPDF